MDDIQRLKAAELLAGDSFLFLICDALRDLVIFVQFNKREKHP